MSNENDCRFMEFVRALSLASGFTSYDCHGVILDNNPNHLEFNQSPCRISFLFLCWE